MTAGTVFWQTDGWWGPALVVGFLLLVGVGWSYLLGPGSPLIRCAAATCKLAALGLLLACLFEPLMSSKRPQPGANVFLVVADTSRSLTIADGGRGPQTSDEARQRLQPDAGWLVRLEQDFDVRRYTLAERLQSTRQFRELQFDGHSSRIGMGLETLARRFTDRPLAGILLFTDGNATDFGLPEDTGDFPPVYPVTLGNDRAATDVSVSEVAVSEANFQVAPVAIRATIVAQGVRNDPLVIQITDLEGEVLEQQTAEQYTAGEPLYVRFRIKPPEGGLQFFRVRCFLQSEMEGDQPPSPDTTSEATLENNSRLTMVDRGGGPYRILYVSGRPNWEFKFLRRALHEDDEVRLVGLIRIAKEEPKFTFRGHLGETSNPLFRGFDQQDAEEIEQYDEAVLLRLGVEDESELQTGFPQDAEDLYEFHGLILDDVEVDFFTHDQMSLIQEFVSHRGGGMAMLGGLESFAEGGYRRTPIGDLLPVYLHDDESRIPQGYRMELTRDGLQQPWVRLRGTQEEELERLRTMPGFSVLNAVSGIKPGAMVLADLRSPNGTADPALAIQRFGSGRVAAVMVGDLWRWSLQRDPQHSIDSINAWRQLARWMVADVPRRLEIDAKPDPADGQVDVRIMVRNARYEPEVNPQLQITVRAPDGTERALDAQPGEHSGEFLATYTPRQSGAFRVTVAARDENDQLIDERDSGWVSQPETDEFASLTPNHDLLQRIAETTGGEVLETPQLSRFVASLQNRKVPIQEDRISELWHHWTVFVLIAGLLIGEWALRRVNGLA